VIYACEGEQGQSEERLNLTSREGKRSEKKEGGPPIRFQTSAQTGCRVEPTALVQRSAAISKLTDTGKKPIEGETRTGPRRLRHWQFQHQKKKVRRYGIGVESKEGGYEVRSSGKQSVQGGNAAEPPILHGRRGCNEGYLWHNGTLK